MNWLPDEKRPLSGTCEAAVGKTKVSENQVLNIIIRHAAQDDYGSFSSLRPPELGQIIVGHSDLG
jgi:hypothetical protein